MPETATSVVGGGRKRLVGWVLLAFLAPVLGIPTASAAWTMSRKRWWLPTERPLATSIAFGSIAVAASLVVAMLRSAFPRLPSAVDVLLTFGTLALLVLLPAGLVIRARHRRWSRFPGLSPERWANPGKPTPKPRTGVFVSYRREDTQHVAGRLSDRLHDALGKRRRVFTDVDSIGPGLDFVKEIERAMEASRVMLVVIGDRWLTVMDPGGWPRLNDPEDVVRLEVEAGLRHGLRVIPVLVDGAAMPKAAELPESLRRLPYLNAVEVRHVTFGQDARRLVDAVKGILKEK